MIDASRLDAERGNDAFSARRHTRPVEHAGGVGGEQRVLRERQPGHRAMAEPLFRHAGHTGFAPRVRTLGTEHRAVDGDRVRRGQSLADQRLHQLDLPVAGHTGDADDFAGMNLERNIRQ